VNPQAAASPPRFELRERSCPTCEIPAGRTLGLRGGAHHRYGLGITVRIVQCERCRLVFPNPFPYAESLAELYSDDTFPRPDGGGIERCRVSLQEGRRLVNVAQPTFLDVGCGFGPMLGAARLENFGRTVGLEIAEPVAARAEADHGAPVYRQRVEDFARSTDETFDIVALSGVLEHVYDPDGVMAALKKLTRLGSVLYIDVPCEPSLLTHIGNAFNRLRGSQTVLNLSPTWPPYHVFGFNRTALTTLLAKHSFRLESLEIWGAPDIRSGGQLTDKVKSLVGTQINRLANLVGMANNMSGWARRV
jgi:SAM-dependent methyltransferase